ncbi:YlzJ-like family protein [Lederbergia citrea]|uniref:YlzJ-like family protein n=1 Tax=Lederbergia citrea TaxID=2833581 RepID=A0A942UN07_9BACI|nr:YlzJ-like family protein [Lederbergia citrea]MBS4177064.1 YlzJ-like family protein [Lederbergia citrea]MBS4203726.1 YlzJ-like family protein [Lederbergia citrea]MBS4221688.1 YlzJ-like family protein [Lederbergia citrea]
MIIHSIVPPELIFQDNAEHFSGQMSLTRNGIPMIVEQSGNMYKVIRIMSSDPADYLRMDFHPGSYISLYE